MSDKLPEGTSAKASGAKPAATATAKAGAPAEATPDTTATATDLTPESLAQALDLASDWDNPLRHPGDRRLPKIAGPSGLVIFGVTGDLARKKLMPAVYDLANRGLLPPGFSLVGFARRDWEDEDFAQIVHDSVREHARTEFREEVWQQLAEGMRFIPGDFGDDQAFKQLRSAVEELDASRGTSGNYAFYLSVPPKFFPKVVKQLKKHGLADAPAGSWRRAVIEKPFGHNLKSARELNKVLHDVFDPEQVFRIDHYLGKETVQNILALRFANQMYEPVWNRSYVDHVQITMAEDIGIGGRAGLLRRHRLGP
jgi:glucose-6-phosphate 1-dehydrogenase